MFVAAMPNITFWHDFVWFSFPMWARRFFFFRFKLTFSYGISVSLLRKKITDPPRQIVKQECISPPKPIIPDIIHQRQQTRRNDGENALLENKLKGVVWESWWNVSRFVYNIDLFFLVVFCDFMCLCFTHNYNINIIFYSSLLFTSTTC